MVSNNRKEDNIHISRYNIILLMFSRVHVEMNTYLLSYSSHHLKASELSRRVEYNGAHKLSFSPFKAMNSPRASNRRLVLASMWNFINFLSPLWILNFARIRKRAQNYIRTREMIKLAKRQRFYTISRNSPWKYFISLTVEQHEWYERVNSSQRIL